MTAHLRLFLLATVVVSVGLPPAAFAQAGESAQPSVDKRLYSRIIVKLKETAPNDYFDGSTTLRRSEAIKALGVSATAKIHSGIATDVRYLKTIHRNTHVAITDRAMQKTELQAIAAEMAKDPNVAIAEVDEYVHSHAIPNDPAYGSRLWNLKAASNAVGGANFVNAWDRTQSGINVTGNNVVIAVLDTGYRPHADLTGNIVGGYDFVNAPFDRDSITGRDPDAQDPGDWSTTDTTCSTSSWHGTHVTGIAGATGNNNYGILGGAYGAKILPVRVLGICGGWSSDIQEGMYWAAGLQTAGGVYNPNIAKVINLSLGGDAGVSCSASYQLAVNAVINAGVTVVASTGNDSSTSAISSPANCSGVIAVTAHQVDGGKPAFANVGSTTALSAPGVNIYSTSNSGTTIPASSPGGDNFSALNGTSMAAPHVAAAAALLYQVNPGISPALVRTLLTGTARPFPINSSCYHSSLCGSGMLDAFAAVKKLQLATAGINNPPVLAPIAPQSGSTADVIRFTAQAVDADGDPISYMVDKLPAGASFDNGTGEFVWSSPSPGTYTLTINATDGLAVSAPQSSVISIANTAAPSSGGGGGAIPWWELCVLLAAVSAMRTKKTAPDTAQSG